MGDLLNNLTSCQLAQLKAEAEAKKIKRTEIPCAWCDAPILSPRPQQRFCSTKCRVGFSDAVQLARISNLEREKADWINERIALIAEIHKYKALAGVP